MHGRENKRDRTVKDRQVIGTDEKYERRNVSIEAKSSIRNNIILLHLPYGSEA